MRFRTVDVHVPIPDHRALARIALQPCQCFGDELGLVAADAVRSRTDDVANRWPTGDARRCLRVRSFFADDGTGGRRSSAAPRLDVRSRRFGPAPSRSARDRNSPRLARLASLISGANLYAARPSHRRTRMSPRMAPPPPRSDSTRMRRRIDQVRRDRRTASSHARARSGVHCGQFLASQIRGTPRTGECTRSRFPIVLSTAQSVAHRQSKCLRCRIRTRRLSVPGRSIELEHAPPFQITLPQRRSAGVTLLVSGRCRGSCRRADVLHR